MAKISFRYGAMGSSKTANMLMIRYNFEEHYGEKAIRSGRLYLFKGKSKVAQVSHRDCSGFITFDEVQEFLDKTL